MKATISLKVKSVLAVFLAAAQLVIVPVGALAAPAKYTTTVLPDGIYLSDTMTQDDAAYLAASLEYLHAQLPQWWKYVMNARPFTLSFDPAMAADGRAAVASCCDEQGRGRVALGYHPGQLTLSKDPASETAEASIAISNPNAFLTAALRSGRFQSRARVQQRSEEILNRRSESALPAATASTVPAHANRRTDARGRPLPEIPADREMLLKTGCFQKLDH